MATFLVCHGAWSGGWGWGRVRPLLRAAGHEIVAPTYTGLGERAHLISRSIDLETHIADVLGVIEYEDLRDVILLGHSYGGMVSTGVADRAADRVRHFIYLDAFVPRDGQSLDDLAGSAREAIDGWLIPPMPASPHMMPETAAWTAARRHHQPAACFAQKLRLTGAVERLARTYIYCAKKPAGDVFRQFADRFHDDPAWRYVQRDWDHSPNFTAPEELAALLDELAGQ